MINTRHFYKEVLTKHTYRDLKIHTVKKGEFITHEGDDIHDVYFLLDGIIKVFKNFLNGKTILIGFFRSPTILGDVEYVLKQKATCTVEALQDVSYIKISMNELDYHYKTDISFQRFFTKQLSRKLLHSNNSVSLNLMYPLETRLSSYIISEDSEQQNTYIDLFNLTDLANHLGTSYRHLHRTIAKLIEQQTIKKNGSKITILDYDKLLQLAEGNIYEMENEYDSER
jgi:CRP-like cAMP-binding protein